MKFKRFVAAAAIMANLAPALAAASEPAVMWRSSNSGLLTVNPLASPGTPPDDGQGGGAVAELGLEAPSMFIFYTAGPAEQRFAVSAYEGTRPFTFSISGDLPEGLRFMPNSNGEGGETSLVIGLPKDITAEIREVTVSAVDAEGRKGSRSVKFGVLGSPMVLAGDPNPSFQIGSPGLWTYPVANAVGAVSYRLFGSLPAGLTMDVGNGTIMGYPVPGSAGSYPVTVYAADSIGQVAQVRTTITVTD